MGRESTALTTQDQIKQYMLDHRLRPGDPMPTETVLCEQLGVSRSSVREAVRTLIALDILEVRHGHGTFVGDLSLAPLVAGLTFRGVLSPGNDRESLRDVVGVRTLLDLGMADEVCQAFQGSSCDELDVLVEQMVELAEAGRSFAEQDQAFHRLLLQQVPNTLLQQLVDAMWQVHTEVTPRLGVPEPSDITDTARAHGEMLAAARAGDPAAYRTAVRRHYAPLQRVLDR